MRVGGRDPAEQGEPELMAVELEPGVVVGAWLAQEREERRTVLIVDGLVRFELQAAFDQPQRLGVLLPAGEVDGQPREPGDIHPPHGRSIRETGPETPHRLDGTPLAAALRRAGRCRTGAQAPRPANRPGGREPFLEFIEPGAAQLEQLIGECLLARPGRKIAAFGGDLGGERLAFLAAGEHELRGDVEPRRGVGLAPRQARQQLPQPLELGAQLRLGLEEPRGANAG